MYIYIYFHAHYEEGSCPVPEPSAVIILPRNDCILYLGDCEANNGRYVTTMSPCRPIVDELNVRICPCAKTNYTL